MWTKLLLGGARVLALVALGCASSQAPPKRPTYLRSPSLDYVDAPRSASDGETLGAHRQAPDDWIEVLPTNEHQAVGWETRYGRFQFRRELARAGHGALIEEPACNPPVAEPVRSASEVKARAALYRAWLASQQAPYVATATSAVQLDSERSHLLDCNR